MPISLSALATRTPAVVVHGRGSSPNGWTLDVDALERACKRLGLTQPVAVAVTRGRGGRRKDGLHYDANGEHIVSVVGALTREEASRTLWHELEHACQLEAHGPAFHQLYRSESRANGYRTNRFEVAARRAERRHDVWFALTH